MNRYAVVYLDHETKCRRVVEIHAFDKEDVSLQMITKHKVKDNADILKITLKEELE